MPSSLQSARACFPSLDGQAYAVEKENLALIEHKSLIEEAEDLLLAGSARALKSKRA
jgi:hypothetical protein